MRRTTERGRSAQGRERQGRASYAPYLGIFVDHELLPTARLLGILGPGSKMVQDDGACHRHVQAGRAFAELRDVHEMIAQLLRIFVQPNALVAQNKRGIPTKGVCNHVGCTIRDLNPANTRVLQARKRRTNTPIHARPRAPPTYARQRNLPISQKPVSARRRLASPGRDVTPRWVGCTYRRSDVLDAISHGVESPRRHELLRTLASKVVEHLLSAHEKHLLDPKGAA